MMAVELKHNDDVLGIVDAGAVDVYPRDDASDARFWAGLRALRRHKSVCQVPVHVVMGGGMAVDLVVDVTRSVSSGASSTRTD